MTVWGELHFQARFSRQREVADDLESALNASDPQPSTFNFQLETRIFNMLKPVLTYGILSTPFSS
jgi:hypothetical protein